MNGRPLARATAIVGGVAVAGAGALTVALISGVTGDAGAQAGTPSTGTTTPASGSTATTSTPSANSGLGSVNQGTQPQGGSNGS
jgi:hypothetical protein